MQHYSFDFEHLNYVYFVNPLFIYEALLLIGSSDSSHIISYFSQTLFKCCVLYVSFKYETILSIISVLLLTKFYLTIVKNKRIMKFIT